MRVPVSLVCISVFAFCSTQAFALGCKDISGAKFDPDLKILTSNFGRLLPSRKSVNRTKQQGKTLRIERIVAAKIKTSQNNANANLMLGSDNATTVVAIVNGQTTKQKTASTLANLGYGDSATKITAALAKIDQPAKSFVSPKINLSSKLNSLSAANPKISLGQHTQKIVGTPTTEKHVAVQYTCTKDMEFAGNPAVLRTMVILRGVLKATTVTTITKINRFVDVQVNDVAVFKTVTPARFKKILSPLPDIVAMLPVEVTAEPKPDPEISATPQMPPVPTLPVAQTTEPTLQTSSPPVKDGSFQPDDTIEKLKNFFSLSKPETWLMLFLSMILANILFLRSRKTRNEPDHADAETALPPKTNISSEPKMAAEPEMQNDNQQVEDTTENFDVTAEESKDLRNANFKLKTRLDKAENQSRELTTQMIELQTSVALMKGNLTADKSSVYELEGSNQRLMGVNQGYRDHIKNLEAEYTSLMHKLNLREDALSHIEMLNNEMQGFNEELNYAYLEEKAARKSLETDYDRLTADHNKLWEDSSEQAARFRENEVQLKGSIRQLRDDLISLETELNLVREDHENLNREFIVLGTEHARASNEHQTANSFLESKVKQLQHDLAYYRQLLDENRIRIPERSHLSSTSYQPRNYSNYRPDNTRYQEDRNTGYETDDNPGDNVVPLNRLNRDRGA